MKISGIRTEMPRLSGQDSESSRNRNRVLSLCSLGTGIGIEFKACAVSEPDSESCSSHGQSRNRNRNRVPRLDSLRTGIGIEKTGTGNLWLKAVKNSKASRDYRVSTTSIKKERKTIFTSVHFVPLD